MPQFISIEVDKPFPTIVERVLKHADPKTGANPLRVTNISDRLHKPPTIMMGPEDPIALNTYFIMCPCQYDGALEIWPIMGIIEKIGPGKTRVSVNEGYRSEKAVSSGYAALEQCLGIDF